MIQILDVTPHNRGRTAGHCRVRVDLDDARLDLVVRVLRDRDDPERLYCVSPLYAHDAGSLYTYRLDPATWRDISRQVVRAFHEAS